MIERERKCQGKKEEDRVIHRERRKIEEEGRESVFVKERKRKNAKDTGEVGNVCTGDSDH